MTRRGSTTSFLSVVAVVLLVLLAEATQGSQLVFRDPDVKQPNSQQQQQHHAIRKKSSPSTEPAKSIECTVCDLILKVVDEQLSANTTEEEILQLLKDVCDIFDAVSSLKKACENIVEEYAQVLIFILEEELAADRVCNDLQICLTNLTAPVHVHLALTGSLTEMSVSWFTYGDTATSTARWSLSSKGQIVGTAQGTTSSYLPGGGVTHKVVMTGLKPGTRYYYTVGDSAGGWSPEYSFVTPPPTPQKFSIGLYGDMGVHYSENTFPRIRELVNSKRVDWIYHVGDIGYGDDYPGNVYEYVWNSWFKAIEPIASAVPYQTCAGNHEYNCQHPTCAWFSGNFAAYNSRFRMPGLESGSNNSMFFSFDYSYVHFISVSTETDYPQSPYPSKFGNQLQWLENDLKKANASRSASRPWIIVIGHRPMYSSNAQMNGRAMDYALPLQTAMEDMFHRYGVDIYFAGHVHAYERDYPTYANKKMATNYNNPPATTHVVAGAAGCIEGLSSWKTSPPDWTAFRFNEDQGYGILDITQTTLSWNYYSSKDGILRDSFVLTKTKQLPRV